MSEYINNYFDFVNQLIYNVIRSSKINCKGCENYSEG